MGPKNKKRAFPDPDPEMVDADSEPEMYEPRTNVDVIKYSYDLHERLSGLQSELTRIQEYNIHYSNLIKTQKELIDNYSQEIKSLNDFIKNNSKYISSLEIGCAVFLGMTICSLTIINYM